MGRLVAEQGAKTLKRICLELGGKTPLIVFEYADMEAFAPLVVTALTKFNGEFCMTGSRVLVQRSVADAWRCFQGPTIHEPGQPNPSTVAFNLRDKDLGTC